MKQFNIFDMHCDTLSDIHRLGKEDLATASGHINLEKLWKGGSLVQCFAAFIPTHEGAVRRGITEGPYEYFLHCADTFDRQMEKFSDQIRPVRTVAEIEKNRDAGLLSAMLTIEDAVPVEGRIERVKEFYDRGVRMMSLTWNYENSIGYPNSRDPEAHMLPLKPFGLEVIAEMERLGMAVDVSHLSEGGFWDVANHGSKPFIASHSCARALSDHPRNLTDDQLRAVAKRGGVVGVNFCKPFLRLDATVSTVEDIVRHARYIANVAGIETVAMGSDFDGISGPLEYEDFSGFPMIVDGLSRVFSDDDVDRICHGNALRAFRDIFGE